MGGVGIWAAGFFASLCAGKAAIQRWRSSKRAGCRNFLILLALTIVVSLQTVGVGLVAAMLVTPAATAYLLTRRLRNMMLLSAGFGGLSSLVGLYVSYYANVVSGAAVVLTATVFFLLAFLFAPQRGLVWKKARANKV